jgi:hypothetical protein
VTAGEVRARLALHRLVLRRNLDLLARFAAGVDEAAARTAVLPGGSHLAWLLAHLAVSRDVMLTGLGQEGVLEEGARERFGRGSDPAAVPEYPPVDELLARLEAQQERLSAACEALGALADEGLTRSASGDVDLGRLEFLVWHETYHLGQALLYRRAAGLASPIG